MKENRKNLYLNRLGSNPLEHTFGMIRMRSRDKDTLEQLQKKIGQIQLLRKIKEEMNITNDICGRTPEFGKVIDTTKFVGTPFLTDTRDIALCLHEFFGNKMKSDYLNTPFYSSIKMLAKQVVDIFYGQLVAIWLQIHPVPDKIRLCSSHLSVNNNCRIINRLKDIRIIDENKWNDDRDKVGQNWANGPEPPKPFLQKSWPLAHFTLALGPGTKITAGYLGLGTKITAGYLGLGTKITAGYLGPGTKITAGYLGPEYEAKRRNRAK